MRRRTTAGRLARASGNLWTDETRRGRIAVGCGLRSTPPLRPCWWLANLIPLSTPGAWLREATLVPRYSLRWPQPREPQRPPWRQAEHRGPTRPHGLRKCRTSYPTLGRLSAFPSRPSRPSFRDSLRGNAQETPMRKPPFEAENVLGPIEISLKGFLPYYPPLLLVHAREERYVEALLASTPMPSLTEVHKDGLTPKQTAFYLAQGVFCARAPEVLRGEPNRVLPASACRPLLFSSIQALSAEIQNLSRLFRSIDRNVPAPDDQTAYSFVAPQAAYGRGYPDLSDFFVISASEVGGSGKAKKTTEALSKAFANLVRLWNHVHGLRLIAQKWSDASCQLDSGTLSAFNYYVHGACHQVSAAKTAFDNASALAHERRDRGVKVTPLPYTAEEVLTRYEAMPKGDTSDYERYEQVAEQLNAEYPKAPKLSLKRCKQLCTQARTAKKRPKRPLKKFRN